MLNVSNIDKYLVNGKFSTQRSEELREEYHQIFLTNEQRRRDAQEANFDRALAQKKLFLSFDRLVNDIKVPKFTQTDGLAINYNLKNLYLLDKEIFNQPFVYPKTFHNVRVRNARYKNSQMHK